MSAITGISAIGNYAGAATDSAAIDILIALIPNPDSTSTSGAITSGAGSMLDEMSPMAAAQLRVELLALKNAIDTTNTL